MSPDALRKCSAHKQGKGFAKDSGAFNGMIAPLLNTTIKGAIWVGG